MDASRRDPGSDDDYFGWVCVIVQMDSGSYNGYVGTELRGVEECCEGVEALRAE